MNSSITADTTVPHRTQKRELFAHLDRMAALAASFAIAAATISPALEQGEQSEGIGNSPAIAGTSSNGGAEIVASAYIGAPLYHPSDVQLKRPNGTDITLERMGWDGDALYFPIDGGARVVHWSGARGLMVDFLHNKAVSRLGKGAHGRKIKDGVVEDVETRGTLKGQPAPSPLHLTDLFERLEFTHGHNTLLLTGLARLAPIAPKVRPYLGVGFGVAVPHVEVRFTGETAETRTNEYQYAGPAFQVLAGLELRSGRGSYFIEYKFIWSAIDAALSGGNSWSLKDLNLPWLPHWLVEPFAGLSEMPGDLWNQFTRWRTGEAPAQGTLKTELTSHTIVVGAGYVWPRPVSAEAVAARP